MGRIDCPRDIAATNRPPRVESGEEILVTETLGFSLGPPSSGVALGLFSARSEWLEERRSSIELVTALDEAVEASLMSVLRRFQTAAVRLQIESGGRAFGDAFQPRIEVVGNPVASLLNPGAPGSPYDRPSIEGMVLGSVDLPAGQIRLVTSWTEFGEGSFWSKFGAALEHGALIAATSLALAGPVEDIQRDMQWRGQIERVLNGAPCRSVAEFDPSLGALRAQTTEALRFDRMSPAHPDHAARVCTVQLLLRWAGEHPGPIDGVPGPMTRKALNSFAAKHGLQPGDGRVFDILVDQVQPPRD